MHYNSFMIKQWQIDGGYCFLRSILCLLIFTAMGSEAWGQTAGVTLSATKLSLNEGTSGNYTMNLNTQPTGNVTVTIASNNAEVTTNPSALTFSNSDWSTAQTVTVTAGEDNDSLNETATLSHTVSGYGVTSADNVTVGVADNEASGICGRTQQVRAAIVAAVSGITDCANITATHLGNITGTLRLDSKRITTLQAGDFAGLTALIGLFLHANQLQTLPAGVFAELTALTWLNLSRNQFGSLPAGVFDELTALRVLWLYNNQLGRLPAGVFDELTALTTLWLENNQLDSLPAGVFDGLTALTTLNLSSNQLDSLPAGVFDGLTALRTLNLWQNQLSSLPPGVFDGLTALTQLQLYRNRLSRLPAGVFDGLTALTTLNLSSNQLSSLPAGVFDELTALTTLWLGSNQLGSLPAGVFDGLTALTTLWLGSNQLSSLPAGVFDELTALTELALNHNRLSTLPAGVFAGLTRLDRLGLQGNPVDPMPLPVSIVPTVVTGQVKATIPSGAPFALTLPVTVTNGTTTVSSVSIATGSTESAAFTITRTDANQPSAVNLGTLPDLPTDTFQGRSKHQGYHLVKAGLPLRLFTPGVTVSPTSLNPVEGSSGSYTIRLNDLPTGNVTVTITSTNTEVTTSPGALTFSNSDWTTAQTVTVTAGQDTDSVADTASISHTISGYRGVTTAPSVRVTVTDDNHDNTRAQATPVALNTMTTGHLHRGDLDYFRLTITRAATLVAETSGSTDTVGALYNVDGTRLTSNDNRGSRTNFQITRAVTAGTYYIAVRGFNVSTTGAYTLNVAVPRAVTLSTPRLSLDEGSSGNYTMNLNTQPTGNVTVTITSNNAEVTTNPSALTFTNSDWATAQTVTVSAGEDTDAFNDRAVLSHGVSGYATVMHAANVVVAVTDDEAMGICDRTQQVRAAIVDKVSGITDCANITAMHLENITGSLGLGNKGITTLQAGDFAGLTALTTLQLFNNQLGRLPAGVFDELTALTELWLSSNRLSSLPAGVFDELTELTELWLSSNRLSSLPAGVFDELTVLTQLTLYNNQLRRLPAGVFDELTALRTLSLNNNQLGSLPAGVFDELTALTELRLNNNQLSRLPAGVFDELTALQFLYLFNNQLSDLPAGVFDGLTALTRLQLFNNQLGRLPAGVFDELTVLTELYLNNNQLRSIPAGVFAGLTRLDSLYLQGNPVDPLPLSVSIVPTSVSGQVKATIPSGAPFALTLPVTVTNGTTTASRVSIAPGRTESTAFTITQTDTSQSSSVDLGTLPGLPGNHLGYTLVKSGLPLRLFAPGVTISHADLSLTEGGLSSYTIRLNDLPTGNVTVTITSTNAEVTTSPGALTFTNSDWTTAQTVTVNAGQDTDSLDDTASISHAISDYSGVTTAPSVRVTVSDDNHDNTRAQATSVALNTMTTGRLHSGDLDYFQLTITRAATLVAETSGSINTVGALYDADGTWLTSDDNRGSRANFQITRAVTAGTYYIAVRGFNVSTTGAYTLNVTVPRAVTLSTTRLSLDEGSSGNYTMNLNTQPTGNVTVTITSNNAEITTSPGALTFSNSDWATAQTVTVSAGEDANAFNDRAVLSHGVSGYATVMRAANVVVAVTDDEASGICDRTQQVRAAIVALVSGITDCANITAMHLENITGSLNLVNRNVTTLQAGDFAGLTALTTLRLENNQLSSLPARVFDELIALTQLQLYRNRLSRLPAGVFDELTALTTLTLSSNQLRSLPTGVFDELTALTSLSLGNNQLSSLPAGVFDELTALTSLSLRNNQLGSLPAGVFDELTALTGLDLWENQLSSLPAGVFDELTALTSLNLRNNQLGSLPAGVFDELTALTGLYLWENQLSSLPAGVFDELTALRVLELDNNQLSSLPAGVFAGLTNLGVLRLQGNPVDPLPLSVSIVPTSVTGQVKATIPSGAPFALTLPVTVTNGTTTVSSVSIAPGRTESTTFTITRTDTSQLSSVDLDTLPGLPSSNHQGYTLVKSGLPLQLFAPGVTANPNTGLTTDEAGGQATFAVQLNSEPTSPVTISLSSNASDEGTVMPTSLSFATTAWDTAQTVAVTGVDDDVADGTQSYMITLDPSSGDADYDGLSSVTVSVTNTDDDTAGITANPNTGLTTGEDGGQATFAVQLDSEPTSPVTISLSSNTVDEGTVMPTSLSFATDAWNTAQTVTVTGVDDAIADGNQAYMVTLAPSSGDTNYNDLSSVTVNVTNTDNDTAGITASPNTGLTTTEAGGQATFAVQLDSEPTSPVTISLSSNAVDEGTVMPTSLSFATDAWNTAQTVTVTGVDDAIADGNQAYMVTLAPSSGDTNYNDLSSVTVNVTNTDNDTAGITANPNTGLTTDEAGGQATFAVQLDSEPTSPVTISLSSNAADEGTVMPTSLSFATDAWNTAQTVTVTGVDDDVADGNQAYMVTLAPSSGDTNYNDLSSVTVSVTNTDDDAAGITANPNTGLTTDEAGGQATFAVQLDSEPTSPVTISLSSNAADEGTVMPTSLSFATDAWNTAQTVTVTGVDDAIADGNQAYMVTLAPSSGDTNYNDLSSVTVNVTNTDNDTAGITANPNTGLTTGEDGGQATFAVQLDSEPTSPVTISLSSNAADEGTVMPTSLSFATDAWNTAQTVTVTGVDDAIADGNQAYMVTLAPSSSDTNYNDLSSVTVSVTNTDDDAAGITANPSSGLTTDEAGATDTFTVVLSTQPTDPVTISLSSNDTGEGTVAPGILTFATDAWDTAQIVTVTGVDDDVADGTQSYTITLDPSSGDTNYDGLSSVTVGVTNTDDDAAGITANPSTGLTTTEAGTTDTFTVVLSTQPTDPVTISLSSNDTGEGTVAPGILTFATDAWDTAQIVTVTGVDDDVADGTQSYTITLDPSSGDANYDGLSSVTVGVTNTDDDAAGITANPNTGLTTGEASTTDTFTVVLNTQPTDPVTISLSSNDTGEGTVAPGSLTFATDAWDTAQIVTVTGVDDDVADGTQPYTITLDPGSSDTNYNGLSSVTVNVTNTDDDTAGITANPNTGLTTDEAGGQATFAVQLDSEPTSPVTISLSSNAADEGTVMPTSLSFATDAWDTAQIVTVTGVDDAIADGNQAYMITLDPSSSDTNYNDLSSVTVSVTNTDDDTAGITANPNTGLTTGEDGTTDTFTVVLSTQPTDPVTINLSSSDTGEGTVAPGSLTFATDAWDTAQTVTVTGVDDAIADGNQAYMVTLAPSSGDTNYNDLSSVTVSVTNTDDDAAGITANPSTGLTTDEAGATDTFTVVLSTEPTDSVTMSLSSSNTGEGTVAPGVLTFATDAWNTAQTVTVTGVDDDVADGTQSYTITLDPSSGDTNYNDLSSVTVSVTNTDDDTAGITANPGTGLTTGEAGTTDTFTVVLSTQPTDPVTMSLSSSDTGEGTVAPGSLTFATDAWNTAQTVTVTGVNDAIADGNQAYMVTLAPSSGDTNYNDLSSVTVSVTNTDDDTAGITANPNTGLTTGEDGTTDTFTVVLSTQPTDPVTINLSSSDTGEGTVAPGSLTFATDAWDTAQTVTVTGVDDAIADGNQAYMVTLAPSSGDADYDGLSSVTVSVTNTDDDTAGITANPNTGLTTGEAGTTDTFTVVLSTQPTDPVTISLSSNAADEGTVAPGSLTFATDAWDTAQTVTVTGVDDAIADGTQSYMITLDPSSGDTNYDGLSSVTVSVTNTDDDAAGITASPNTGLTTGEDGGQATFAVQLDSEPTSPVTISLSSNAVDEGTVMPTSLTFATDAWSMAQTVTVTGVNDAIADGNQAYMVTLAPSSSDTSYNDLSSVTVSVTNTDDDAAGITANPSSGLTTDEAGTTDTFTVVLNTEPANSVTISLSSNATDEGTVMPISLSFATTAWNTAQTVTVTGVDDAIADGPQGYTITLVPSSGDTNYNDLNSVTVGVTNTDDDMVGVVGVTLSETRLNLTEGSSGNYTMNLNTQPTGNVTVTITSNNAEVTTNPSALTFTNSDWATAQTVTVSAGSDADSMNDSAQLSHTVSGYGNVMAAAVVVAVTDDEATGICGRTQQVRDAIVAAVSGITDCANITATHLGSITGTLSLDNKNITTLQAGDFAGLTALTTLNLDNNQLGSLPAGVFDELTELTQLQLQNNQLRSLPAGAFDELTELTQLQLQNNRLSSLPAGVFDGLTELTQLQLQNNRLSSLPAGAFDELTELTQLQLQNNRLSSLPTGVFDELTELTQLQLQNNRLSSLPAGVFDELTALTQLQLQNNRLSSLPAGVFDELTALTQLQLQNNRLSSLPAGVFDELTALTGLNLGSNQLSSLPAGVFDELTALTELYLNNNQLRSIPAGVFAGLINLDVLRLQGNPVDPMPLPVSIVPTVVTGQVKATIPSGAPFALALPVTVTNGTTTSRMFIAAGGTESNTFTITRTDANQPSAIDISTLPDLPTDTFPHTSIRKHQGYRLVKSGLPLRLFTPGVTVSHADLSLTEGGLSSYTIRLNDLPTGNVTVTITSTNAEVTTSPGALTFTNNDWTTAQTVTVTAGRDTDSRNDTASISHTISDYSGVTTAPNVRVTVSDDNHDNTRAQATPVALNTMTTGRLHRGDLDYFQLTITRAATLIAETSGSINTVGALYDTDGTWLTSDDNRGSRANFQITRAVTAGTYYIAVRGFNVSTTGAYTLNVTVPRAVTLSTTRLSLDEGSSDNYTMKLNTQPTGNVIVTITSNNAEVTTNPSALTFTDSDWATAQTVTVSAGEDTDAFNDHAVLSHGVSGYATVMRAANVVVAVTDDEASGICGRTQQVRAAIVALVSGITDCANITATHLENITGSLSLGNEGITTLQAGDFAGLTALTQLTLNNNQLSSLPARVFDELIALTRLTLNNNQLGSLPPGVFDELTALTQLSLNNNQLGSLPPGVFDELTALQFLYLFNNQLGSLPPGVFDELTALTQLYLYNNQLSSLPPGVFDELTALTQLTLYNNQLRRLPAGVFDELTALTRLTLYNNQLSRLPTGVFDGLTALTRLYLHSNQLSRLPAGVFAGLTRLNELRLQGNPVDPLPLPVSIVPISVSGQVKATIPSGAPFALTLPVTVTNGTTTSRVSITTGSTESTVFTITRTNTSQPSAVNLGTLPGLPNGNHRGYTLVKSDLPLQLFAPGVTVNPTRLSLVEGSSGSYTVRLNDLPTGNVTVTIASNNAEVTTSPGALTFTNRDWATTQTVTVMVGRDDDALTNTVTLRHMVSGYGSVTAPNMTVIVADDTPGVIVGPSTGLTTGEAGITDIFTVVLSTQPTDPVTISLSSNDADEGTVMPTSLSFATDAWDTAQIVTVTGVDDDVADGTQPYTIILDPSSGDADYDGLSLVTVGIANQDNDVGVIANPSTGLTTDEAGTTDTFTVVLSTQPMSPVTISLSSNAADEGTVMPTSLSFATDAWDTVQIVTVTGVDDDIADGTQSYTITLDPSSGDASYNTLSNIEISATNQDNDVGVIANPNTGLTTTEAGANDTFTVVLSTQPTDPVTISLSSNAADEGTVMPTSLSFATTAWDTAQIVTVTGVDDDVADGTQSYTITLDPNSGDADYDGLSSVTVGIANQDNDVGVIANPSTGLTTDEAGTTDTFTVVLSTQPTSPVTISLSSNATDEGTVMPTSLSFATDAWDTAQIVTVTGVDDDVVDGPQGYMITLDPSSSDASYNTLSNIEISATNQDNNVGVIANPNTGLITKEDPDATDRNAIFTVVLSTQPTDPVTISLSSNDDTEGTVPAQLIFANDAWNTAQIVTVTGVDDDVADGTQSYTITLDPSSGDASYNTLSNIEISATNQDNDVGVIANPSTGLTTTEAGATDTFTVVLSTQPTDPVAINLSSNAVNEGTVMPTSLSFATDAWDIAQTVTVTGVDDDVVDGPQGYMITLDPSSGDASYNTLSNIEISATNQDNDVGVIANPSTGLITKEDPDAADRNATFTVVLSTPPTDPVTISLSSSDADEGTVMPTSLSFATDAWDTAQTVTVTGVDDDVADGTQSYMITLDLSSGDANYNTLSNIEISATNQDNDAGVIANPSTGLITKEDPDATDRNATFTVVLSTPPTAPVTISLSSNDDTEGTVMPTSLSFATDAWNTAQIVTVTGVDDDVADGTQSYTITLDPSSGDASYNTLSNIEISATNQDNDVGVIANPSAGLTTTEAGATTTFTVVLRTQPTSPVTISLSSNDDTEGTVMPTSLSFATTAWDTAQTVTVTGQDDSLVDGTQPYTITLDPSSGDANYDGLSSVTVRVTNTDDEAGVTLSTTRLSLDEGSSDNYTMKLNTQPTGNVTITISSNNAEVTTNPSALTFSNSDWATAQTVTVSAGSDADSMNDTATLSHTVSGYGVTSANNVTVGVADNEASGICGRTQQVRDAIVAAVSGITNCANITTATHLRSLTYLNLGRAGITTLQAGDFAGLTALTWLDLNNNPLSSLPAGVFDELTGLTWLFLYDNQLEALPAGVFDELIKLQFLYLYNNQLLSLPAGVFDELTALTRLWLYDNRLGRSLLPAGVFDKLTALTQLFLDDNQLSNLPAGVFDNLTQLRELRLHNNQLQTLPTGIFAGLTNLNVLLLQQGNPVYPLPLPVSIVPTVVTGQVKATIPSGAPFALALPVTVTNGTTTVSRLSIAAGGTESTPFTITRTDANQPSAVDLGTLPDLPNSNHRGYTLVKSGLPLQLFAPGVTVNPTSLNLVEGSSGNYTVRLNDRPSGNVMVTIASNNDEVVTTNPSALTFTNSDWNTAQTVTVNAKRDDDALTNTVTLRHMVSGYGSVTAPNMTVIVADDTPGVIVGPSTGLTTTETGTIDIFTVELNTQPTAPVTISLSSNDADEGTVMPTSLSFATTAWDTAQTVTVTGRDDNLIDGDQPYTITLNPDSGDADYAGLSSVTVRVTNTDDDTAGVVVDTDSTMDGPQNSGLTTTEAGATDTFTVALSTQPTDPVTISLSSSETSEGTVMPTSLSFMTTAWNTAQTVTVTGQDDSLIDGNQPYTITLDPSSGDANYDGLSSVTVRVTNNDNDAPGVTVDPSTGLTTDETGATDTFTVELNTEPTAAVTVTLMSSAEAEGTVAPDELTFATDVWNTAQTVTVTGVDDNVIDGPQNYMVTLGSGSADGDYSGLSVTVSVTNTDDDAAGVVVDTDSTMDGPQNSGLTTTEASATDTFTVVLSTQPMAWVTLSLSSSETSEGTVMPTSLSFATTAWNTAQTVTVTGRDDSLIDGDQPYTITLNPDSGDANYAGLSSVTVRVTNTDDDTAGVVVDTDSVTAGDQTMLTVTEGASGTYTVVLGTQPADDVTVTVTSNNADVTVDTDSATGNQNILTFTMGNWAMTQMVTVRAAEDTDALNDTAVLSHTVSGYGELATADNVTVTVTDGDDIPEATADVNGDRYLDAKDAIMLFYIYKFEDTPEVRNNLLRQQIGSGDLDQAVFRANAWKESSLSGDLNLDGDVDDEDALIMYYAKQFEDLLQAPGHATLRRLLLDELRGNMPDTDASYRQLLRNAQALR